MLHVSQLYKYVTFTETVLVAKTRTAITVWQDNAPLFSSVVKTTSVSTKPSCATGKMTAATIAMKMKVFAVTRLVKQDKWRVITANVFLRILGVMAKTTVKTIVTRIQPCVKTSPAPKENFSALTGENVSLKTGSVMAKETAMTTRMKIELCVEVRFALNVNNYNYKDVKTYFLAYFLRFL